MTSHWSLLEMRGRLRMVDTQLIVLLARRFEIMRDIREWKQSTGIPLVDSRREQDVLRHCIDLGESLGLPSDLINSLYSQLFAVVRGSNRDDPSATHLTDIKDDTVAVTQNRIHTPESR